MIKKLFILICVAWLLSSANAFAALGGKKGPPAAEERKAWQETVINWF